MLLSPILPQRFQLPESQQDGPKVSPLPPTTPTAITHTQPTASPQPFFSALVNFAIVALMIAVIWARVRAKGHKLSALEWDDYASILAVLGVAYTRRPLVYMIV